MFDGIREVYDTIQKAAPDERGSLTTIMVFKYLALMTYYVVSGLVVWALGRRIIQATFAAIKEGRRERA
jgi:hypothetical protein